MTRGTSLALGLRNLPSRTDLVLPARLVGLLD